MSSLIEIAEAKLELWNLIERCNGEMSTEMDNWLNDVEKNLSSKVDRYHFFLEELEEQEDRLIHQMEEVRKAYASIRNLRESLKMKIKYTMSILGQTDLKGQQWRFKLSTSSPKLTLIEDEIPENYKMNVTVLHPDKSRIIEELNAGKIVPGAKLEKVVCLRSYVNKDPK